jgi:hypothetical protein
MTNDEILEKAILKAKENGLTWAEHALWEMDEGYAHPFGIIFSQEFAQAFFAEEEGNTVQITYDFQDKQAVEIETLTYWQYQLMRMAIEEDPIQYLEQFLTEQEKPN